MAGGVWEVGREITSFIEGVIWHDYGKERDATTSRIRKESGGVWRFGMDKREAIFTIGHI